MIMRGWLSALGVVAGLFGAAGVALAAIGAHMNGSPTVTTSAYFLLFHAGALVGFCALAVVAPGLGPLAAASTIALGTILFSGELAFHALSGVGTLAKAAPIGGGMMIVGWLIAAVVVPLAIGRAAPT